MKKDGKNNHAPVESPVCITLQEHTGSARLTEQEAFLTRPVMVKIRIAEFIPGYAETIGNTFRLSEVQPHLVTAAANTAAKTITALHIAQSTHASSA